MKIIEIQALPNGAHRNQSGDFSVIPDGWAVIPDDMVVPETYPFVNIEVSEITYHRDEDQQEPYTVMTVTSMTAGVLPAPDIAPIRAKKESDISSACNTTIVAGMDVQTSVGVEHFSLQETDQINLTTATNAVQSGVASYPYHADGQLCRMFAAEEILAIANAATQHKLYHTTLCNHLLTWVRRAETIEEINSITYSAENLPSDLAENMANIFTSATMEI